MEEEKKSHDQRSMVDRHALEAIHNYLLTGYLPANAPDWVRSDPWFREVIHQLETLTTFSLELSNGNLEPELVLQGRMAGALKTLQENLRNLTWQTRQISEEDLDQEVQFLNGFSDAFNGMVANLRKSRQILDQRAQQLNDGRRAALNLMLDVKASHEEAEVAYQKLQEQMEATRMLQDQLREQAVRDPLTGCFNRRYLDETIGREFSRAARKEYPICLVMVDIDNFKIVNDTYGHPAGDEVLKALGMLLRQKTRAGDIVVRFGGEEFLIVFPNMDLTYALRRSEIWRKEFADLVFTLNQDPVSVTISLGVACFPQHGDQPQQVIQSADQGLYLAKHSGRNCVKTL